MFAAMKIKVVGGLRRLRRLFTRDPGSPDFGDLRNILSEEEYRQHIERIAYMEKPTDSIKDNESVLSVLSVLNGARFNAQDRDSVEEQSDISGAVHNGNTGAVPESSAVHDSDTGAVQDRNNRTTADKVGGKEHSQTRSSMYRYTRVPD